MPTDKTPKSTSTGRTEGKRAGSSTSGARKRTASKTSRAANVVDFMRDRLRGDASTVTERDVDSLRSSVPEKLEAIDTKQLHRELEWVGEMVERVRTLWDMLFDREYSVDWKSKALAAAALLYFVLPTDLTPDFIPGIGYIDDALVLATLWKLIQEKIDDYMAFRAANKRGARKAKVIETAEVQS